MVGLYDGITAYNLSYGKLEGCTRGGQWRPICAADENSFTAEDVDAACYQLFRLDTVCSVVLFCFGLVHLIIVEPFHLSSQGNHGNNR